MLVNYLTTYIYFFTSLCAMLDGCRAASTTVNPDPNTVELSWPETNVGAEAMIPCPCNLEGCEVSETRYATRRCTGNFIQSGVWASAEDERCVFSK